MKIPKIVFNNRIIEIFFYAFLLLSGLHIMRIYKYKGFILSDAKAYGGLGMLIMYCTVLLLQQIYFFIKSKFVREPQKNSKQTNSKTNNRSHHKNHSVK